MCLLALHKSCQTMLMRFPFDPDPTIVMQLPDRHCKSVILEKQVLASHFGCYNLCADSPLTEADLVMMFVVVVLLRMEADKHHLTHDTEVVHPWTVGDTVDMKTVEVVPNTVPTNPYGGQMSWDMQLGKHLHVAVVLHLNYGLAMSTHLIELDMARIPCAAVADVVVVVVQAIPNFHIDSMMHNVREDHAVAALNDHMDHLVAVPLVVAVQYYYNSPFWILAYLQTVAVDRSPYYCDYQHVLNPNSHVPDLAKKNLPLTYCRRDLYILVLNYDPVLQLLVYLIPYWFHSQIELI